MLDKNWLFCQSQKYHFITASFEKMCRLVKVLDFIMKSASDAYVLKGGTAINLTVLPLSRLSMDIDLNFVSGSAHEAVTYTRNGFNEDLNEYMLQNGYVLSNKTKLKMNMDALIFKFKTAHNSIDALKVENNYILRASVFPVEFRPLYFPMMEDDTEIASLKVRTLHPIELYGPKLCALLERGSPRDLFDVNEMFLQKLFESEQERTLLRKTYLFYSALSIGETNKPIPDLSFEKIHSITQHSILQYLLPIIKRNTFFSADEAKRRCIELLPDLITPNRDEKEFLHRFRNGEYVPELVFGDYPEIVSRISEHPCALLKCSKVFSQEQRKAKRKTVAIQQDTEQNSQENWIEPGL